MEKWLASSLIDALRVFESAKFDQPHANNVYSGSLIHLSSLEPIRNSMQKPIEGLREAPNWKIFRKGHKSKIASEDVLAPPKGLEPLTDWLTASRSTGLSYGGTAKR